MFQSHFHVFLNIYALFTLSPPDPPFHWIPLARLEKNRSRTPLLPEPTAMDMLYEQLKVSVCLAERGTNRESFHKHEPLSYDFISCTTKPNMYKYIHIITDVMFYFALQEKLSFHRHSVQWPHPGLYVGILKLCSSVEQIRVLVPLRLPNLLCHTRVRHNAHVSR